MPFHCDECLVKHSIVIISILTNETYTLNLVFLDNVHVESFTRGFLSLHVKLQSKELPMNNKALQSIWPYKGVCAFVNGCYLRSLALCMIIAPG